MREEIEEIKENCRIDQQRGTQFISYTMFRTSGISNSKQPIVQLLKTSVRWTHEYAPRFTFQSKKQKGRVAVRTGGSTKGSTLQFGTYGIRLKSEGTRMKAQQLKEADNALMRYVRPLNNGMLWRRLVTDIAVCIKGNETRMGKGKGAFDHWMVRVPTGKILFEMYGDNLHERVAREAFRKAGTKLPGVFEFVSRNSPIRVGLNAFKELAPKKEIKIDPLSKLSQRSIKKRINILKSQEDQYRLYRGR
ncbi:similar to Saccharomyces cerevisiae YBL038W MRPL16 Mitochondrial ribosomal protein of the large subunit [Maudiozyma barnettii]|uniref:Similar to Saccharomyces cerevisiae YBL038W MRPL16 Mitochondrial ribosomal protein of the large subunit n=1 Tax=Maudiozyma barnettii TaxID=61262 RepID=A0A8H2ZFC7_9SACH|nr:mitochondrial 54S ribosomal protein YmL47 [Kazachstania barnettii]CAB4253091.1 similar to Saccharomyces cerevisiae YBL038W MRPL16 Mitochondrial ribosomal protein of the large subunit [Kazachstania barnettii]CAD1780374.1 similar to Saccharomyces cerevisiae YBL038W MRPL16 Mitochondrial ribosomal protein of the large subunit [Kazachstania barnettii]